MSTTDQPRQSDWSGWVVFAAAVMITIAAIVINGIGQIAWFPAYPLWSLVAIGLEIAVLYALTAGWKGARASLRGY